jgi:glycosyltransferase involved in cell wall biosynthesis
MAHRSARSAAHFLVAGDEVQAAYLERHGVRPELITRYVYPLDVTVYEASNRMEARERFGLPGEGLIIGTVGRATREKALPDLITAALEALALVPQCMLAVVGDGPELARCREQFEFAAGSILFLGDLARFEVVRFLSAIDIFVYAGVQGTNVSMAVLEAMGAARAVIATTAPRSNAYLLADGRGIAVPPGLSSALSDAIVFFARDTNSRQQAGRMAREFVSQNFAPQTVALRIVGALRAVSMHANVDEL